VTVSPSGASRASDDSSDLALLEQLSAARRELTREVGRRIIGQEIVIENLIAALVAGGHVLLVGVPGVAKTLLIQTIAQALDLSYSRVQFTPDLMPSDITGTEVLEEEAGTGKRVFKYVKGPIFANMVLADEINRAPPKTQAALLQAMQEHTVSAGGRTYDLPEPFFVLATQNPIEQEGTYPLPEAQLDRFMFELRMGYPSKVDEEKIVIATTGASLPRIKPVLGGDMMTAMQQLVRRIPAPPSVVSYCVALVRSTRPQEAEATPKIKEYVSWGAGPRASQYLILGAKARAALDGRSVPDIEDVKSVASAVLRHRLVMNFQAEADGVDAADVIGVG
jgi:MoxR-like ATPase